MSARAKNQNIQCKSLFQLKQLQSEFEDYIGRETSADEKTLTLTVLALPRKYKRKTEREKKIKRAQREKFANFYSYEDYTPEYED